MPILSWPLTGKKAARVKLLYDVAHNIARREHHFGRSCWSTMGRASRMFDGIKAPYHYRTGTVKAVEMAAIIER